MMFWLSSFDADGLKTIRREWRIDSEIVFQKFENRSEDFIFTPDSVEIQEVGEVCSKMWDHIEGSTNEVENDQEQKEELEESSPGK